MNDKKTIKKINRCILGIANNDSRALETLFELTKKQLFIVAKTYLFDKSKAEDVLSESYYKVVKNAKSFNSEYNGYNWLYEIVKNTAYNQNDKDRIRISSSIDDIIAPAFNPIDEILDKILIEEALSKLTDEEKLMIYKIYFEGKTLKELSIELNKPKTTIYDTIQKILKSIRKDFGIADRKSDKTVYNSGEKNEKK